MARQRWFRLAISGLLALIGVGVAIYLLGTYRGPLRKWFMMGIALLCYSPWAVWEIFFLCPIDLTATSRNVVYEFLDEDYAIEFANLNDAIVE